jgi:hypothetical protein
MPRDMENARKYQKEWYEKNKEECKRKARERADAWRKTEDYQKWLIESRDRRLKLKTKYRREAGIITREALNAISARKKEEAEKKRMERREKQDRFVGPPMPRGGTSDYARIRFVKKYAQDETFREKEKKRVSENKKTVPYWYANQLLGGSSTKQFPENLVLVKQLHQRISHTIKEMK